MGSEKGSGITFAVIFIIIGLYPLISNGSIYWWSLIIASILIILAFFTPGILSTPNRLWFEFGIMLGNIIAPIIMALVYVMTVIPTGLFVRMAKKDLLLQKLDKNAKSYWIERKDPVNTMKDQF